MSVEQSSSVQPAQDGAANSKFPLGDFAGAVPVGKAVATLAGGCFWGVEEILRDIKGVEKVQVGYTGGAAGHPVYKEVSGGLTGHAESVQIIYDPKKLSYEELLGWFFRLHDPTSMNRQGNDRGTQYRSAIFVYDQAQRKAAAGVTELVGKSGKWKGPIVTEIVDAKPFWVAEEYHQDYLQKNPNGYTCHFLRD